MIDSRLRLSVFGLLGALILGGSLASSPVQAQCVYCTYTADCGSSQNVACECRIRALPYLQICNEVGFCPEYCGEGPPPVGPGTKTLALEALGYLQDRPDLQDLAYVLRGISVEGVAGLEVPPGDHRGTVARRDESGKRVPYFSYRIRVESSQHGLIPLLLKLEYAPGGAAREVEGYLTEKGWRGELTIREAGAETRAVRWRVEDLPKMQ